MKRGVSNIQVGFALVVLIVLFLSITQAMHIVKTYNDGTFFSVNEDVSFLYNFSINNTGLTAYENITEINITLPTGFSFVTSSNGINITSGVSFSSTSSLLRWYESSPGMGVVANSSKINLWFNATATTPGNYNFTITTLNASGPFNTTLVAINVNDTTVPSAFVFNSPTNASGVNISTNYLSVNVSITDNGNLQSIILYLSNSSGGILNSSTNASSPFYFNFTGLTPGIYRINVTANDSFGNRNWSETRVIILDTTAPTVTLATVELTSSSIAVNITLSDASAGISKACSVDRSGASVSSTNTSQRLSESSLTCNSNYNYTLNCFDTAGNIKQQNASYTTSACTSSDSGSSSGSATSSSVWKTAFTADTTQISTTGYTKEIAVSEAIKVKVNNEDHFVGIISLSVLGATINISSKPQQAIFVVGQTRQFDVDEDQFYDLNVTLRSISATKANVTVLAVHEGLLLQTGSGSANAANAAKTTTTASSNLTGNNTLKSQAEKKSNAGIAYWVVLIAIISLVIVIIGFLIGSYMKKSGRQSAQEW